MTEEGAEGAAGSGALIYFIPLSLTNIICNVITCNSDEEDPLSIGLCKSPFFFPLLAFYILHHAFDSLTTKLVEVMLLVVPGLNLLLIAVVSLSAAVGQVVPIGQH